MPVVGGRHRPKLQGIVDRWVGMNQRSAVATTSTSTNTLPSPSSSLKSRQRPHHCSPAKKTAHRPLKRASYAGHELSSPSVLTVDATTSHQSDYKYHAEALEDDDDQATTITEQTGELTMLTNGSTNTFVSLEHQLQSMAISNSNLLHQHQTFLGLQPQQKVATRRGSAPPLLGLTVETPSPPPRTMSPTLHNHEAGAEDPQNMAVKKSPFEDAPSPNGSTTKKEEMQAQGTATTTPADVATASPTNTTALDIGAINTKRHVPILRKQVSFDPRTRIYLHLHLADFSQDEFAASFLTEEDMDRIQLENVDNISHLRSQINNNHEAHDGGGDVNEDVSSDFTARGLEVMASTESVLAHQATKQAAIDAVMDEQDEQFNGEYCDHHSIAMVYMAETSDSARAAYIRGTSDATYVNRFVREIQGEEY